MSFSTSAAEREDVIGFMKEEVVNDETRNAVPRLGKDWVVLDILRPGQSAIHEQSYLVRWPAGINAVATANKQSKLDKILNIT